MAEQLDIPLARLITNQAKAEIRKKINQPQDKERA